MWQAQFAPEPEPEASPAAEEVHAPVEPGRGFRRPAEPPTTTAIPELLRRGDQLSAGHIRRSPAGSRTPQGSAEPRIRRSSAGSRRPEVAGEPRIRRQMLDEEHRQEFDEVEVAKREARLADLRGQRLVSGRSANAVDDLFAERHAEGEVDRRSKSAQAVSLGTARAAKRVSGRDHGALASAITTRAELGPDHDPEKAAAAPREEAMARAEKLSRQLTAGRKYNGTDDESADIVAFDDAVLRRDWAAANSALTRIEELSKVRLDSLREQYRAAEGDFRKVLNLPAYHQPTTFKATGKSFQDLHYAKDWIGAGRAMKDLTALVAMALSFDERLEEIEAQIGSLTHAGQQANMRDWVEEHKRMTWDEVVASKDKTDPKGGFGNLEYRLDRYETNNSAAASAAKAAAERRQERIREGLIAGNGTVLDRKQVSDYAGEERTSISDGLAAIDSGVAPTLTHSSGAKFGADHKNRDGDLPGTAGAGGYLEYYIEKKPGDSDYHGSRRLVKHRSSGRIYYTSTHYGDNGKPAFVRIK